jgi:hypothetical protein
MDDARGTNAIHVLFESLLRTEISNSNVYAGFASDIVGVGGFE